MPGLATATDDIAVTFLVGGHGDRIVDASLTIPLAGIAGLLPKGAAAPLAPAP